MLYNSIFKIRIRFGCKIFYKGEKKCYLEKDLKPQANQ